VLGSGDVSIASDSIRAASEPDQPDTPVKVSATTSQITIQWTSPVYNGGNSVTDYLIYISAATNTAYAPLAYTGSPGTLTYIATGLTRGELYYFKVTAWNLIGESEASPETSILAATIPLAPAQPIISL
jgi:hypothetical protein